MNQLVPTASAVLSALITAAGIANKLGNHSFRATGISPIANGGALEARAGNGRAREPAARPSSITTNERLTRDKVERIRL